MQGTDKPTAESAVELDESALDAVRGGSSGDYLLKFAVSPTKAARKAGGGQPGVISDPETGGERA